MSWLKRAFLSGVGRKWIVGLTGLALVLFLIAHVTANMQIFLADDSFNEYAKGLHEAWFFPIAEYGLLAAFVVHIVLVLWLARDNRRARGEQDYAVSSSKQPVTLLARFWASKTMVMSGVILILFLIVHVSDFRLRHEEIAVHFDGDLKGQIVGVLSEIWHALLYIAGSLVVAFHMFHGIQSAFRSIGFYHAKYTPIIEKAGAGLAAVIGLGFASIPLWVLLTHTGN